MESSRCLERYFTDYESDFLNVWYCVSLKDYVLRFVAFNYLSGIQKNISFAFLNKVAFLPAKPFREYFFLGGGGKDLSVTKQTPSVSLKNKD